jgi:hypothetical protein
MEEVTLCLGNSTAHFFVVLFTLAHYSSIPNWGEAPKLEGKY